MIKCGWAKFFDIILKSIGTIAALPLLTCLLDIWLWPIMEMDVGCIMMLGWYFHSLLYISLRDIPKKMRPITLIVPLQPINLSFNINKNDTSQRKKWFHFLNFFSLNRIILSLIRVNENISWNWMICLT